MQLSRQKMQMSLTVETTICKLRIHQSAGQLWHLDVSEIFSHQRAVWNIHLFTVIRAPYLLIVNRMEKGIEYGILQGQYKFFSAISRTFINGRRIYGGGVPLPPFTIFFYFWLRSLRYEKDFLQVLSKLSQASMVKIFHFSDEWKHFLWTWNLISTIT